MADLVPACRSGYEIKKLLFRSNDQLAHRSSTRHPSAASMAPSGMCTARRRNSPSPSRRWRTGSVARRGRPSARGARASPRSRWRGRPARRSGSSHKPLAVGFPELAVEHEHRRRAVEGIEQVAAVPELGQLVVVVAPVPLGHHAVVVDQFPERQAVVVAGLELGHLLRAPRPRSAACPGRRRARGRVPG